MKIVKALLFIFALLVIIGALLPSKSHVERSATIDAPQETAFNFLNSYQNFNAWSPWHRIDPETQYSYSGPESGVGAMMSWQSDHDKVGSGLQKITESIPNEFIAVTLDFGDMGQAESSYELSTDGDSTTVVWNFDNEIGWNLVGRYFGLFMDRMLGPSYEAGLHNLKDALERRADGKP